MTERVKNPVYKCSSDNISRHHSMKNFIK